MAACQLKIELEDPARTYVGGETIKGFVLVKSETDVQCKTLELTCRWATHGRGNVAAGDVDQKNLYSGPWQTGQEYRYPFEIMTAKWPPTYYGNYINVSHYVTARAKLPWASDPTTEHEFRLAAKDSPDDLAPTVNVVNQSNWLLRSILIVIAIVVLALFVPFLLLLAPIVMVVGGFVWFFRTFLPRQVTGNVEWVVEPKVVSPGDELAGVCQFTPKWTSQTNGITWTISCIEKVTSGSGSNRKTFTHEVLTKSMPLAQPGMLDAGKTQEFKFSYSVPNTAPPSLKFTDNELTWVSELRIDLPKWPDWKKSIPFVVRAKSPKTVLQNQASEFSDGLQGVDDDPWFTEVLEQVTASKDDDERLEAVILALDDQSFPIEVDVQGEIDEPFEAEIEEEGSLWVSAIDVARNVPMALYVPPSIDRSVVLWTNGWRGNAAVIGFASEGNRVMLRLIP